MKEQPDIMVGYILRSDRTDRTIGVIQVTGLPTEGVFVKPPDPEMPFVAINEIKPFSHMGPSIPGQGVVHDWRVPESVPFGPHGLRVGGLVCWRVRPYGEDNLPVAPCLGQDLQCRIQLDSRSVYPFHTHPEAEVEDRQTGDYERRSAEPLSLTTPYPIELDCDGAEGYGVLKLYSLDNNAFGTGLLRFVHSADWPHSPNTIRLFRFSRCLGSATVTSVSSY